MNFHSLETIIKVKNGGTNIMDFFNKLGNIASKTYKNASQKTGEIAKEAKIKMKMNENKSKINDLYEEIGKIVYQKHIHGEEVKIE